MRLLALDDCNLENGHLSLRTFSGTDIPPYAILSHRWTDDEVLFNDIENNTSVDRAGYFKLRGAISQARADGFAYLWDDTCCIDKSSSAELSEAINSMWVWYRDAAMCYAYLCDVVATAEDAQFEAQVRSSGWFTRGWTLQELIAPKQVKFYNETWSFIGTRQTLHQITSDITGIDADYLNHARPLSSASIAMRMSWAAHRKTTRLEDSAYCLMGLFSVNMAMLYGEGSRAFQRLQEEILRISDDESIFAWVDKEAKASDLHGLLADSPLNFQDSGSIGPLPDRHSKRNPLQTTNLGLHIQRSLISGQMPLLCGYRGRAGYLSVSAAPVGGGQHARCRLSELQDCMGVNQSGNLLFPQVTPHSDRFHPAHETVIRYSVSVGPRTTQDGTYIQDGEKIGAHPMSEYPDPDLAQPGPPKVYEVPKFGTYMDLVLQFKRPADQTWLFVIVGIVDAKSLGFVAGVAYPAFVDRHRDFSYAPPYNISAASNSRFAKSSLPIGSSFNVENLHRVAVRELLADSDGSPDTSHRIKRLEIEIAALEQVEVPYARSCCRVQ